MVPKEEFNDNLGLHYTKQGEGPPAVLVHGFAASNFDWAYLEPDLVENGYQVYSPDLIGHGKSICEGGRPACGKTLQGGSCIGSKGKKRK